MFKSRVATADLVQRDRVIVYSGPPPCYHLGGGFTAEQADDIAAFCGAHRLTAEEFIAMVKGE